MRALLQRVLDARVQVDGQTIGEIGPGLLLFLGVGRDDTPLQISQLARKVLELRIFADEAGKMNRSLVDIQGELLVVPQFTLYGDTARGRRPSFTAAAPPEMGLDYFNRFVAEIRNSLQLQIATGKFGADMKVRLTNDGPVTFWVEV